MGCRITEPNQVTMYDSTTGIAFGPVFGDRQDAEDFMNWNEDSATMGAFFWHPTKSEATQFKTDPRTYTPAELQKVYQLWLTEGRT